MESSLDALKKIYVALGGDADNVKGCVLLSEVISLIAAQVEENRSTVGVAIVG